MPDETPVKVTALEVLPAMEAVWSDNAEGLPEADVVIIRAGESANRRDYPETALVDAVNSGFWDDTPMFVDHGDKHAPRRRSIRDLQAKVVPGSTYIARESDGTKVRGRVQFFNPEFAKTVKNAGKAIGLSAVHEFLGQRFRANDGHMHERVHKFVVNHSLDFVAFPAAGGEITQFRPAMESEGEVDWSRLTDSDWEQLPEDLLRQKRPDMLKAAEADDQGGNDDDEDKAPEGEPKPEGKAMIALEAVQPYIREQVDLAIGALNEKQAKQAETRTKVRELVAKSGLKPLAQADILTRFDGQESYDETAVQSAIEHEAKKLKEAGLSGPIVKDMGESTAQNSDDKASDPTPWTAFESQMDYTPRTGKKKNEAQGAERAN